ncbi:DUF805 domain-containing protein [Pararhizobium arenae]|uniref:DUF805 domain-containing protein n=1 Tax=Pararhizobium arenae TaxID=1856850 RepID=UPI00094B4B18|nr:DUF805 domain-containing protein [Pararhizobium arenae]
MTFGDAASTAFSKYAVFSGRASRSEFWWFTLFNFLVNIVASLVDLLIGTEFISAISALVLLLPALAVGVRRLHDTDRSGWWILLGLVPLIGIIVLIVWYATEGTRGDNRFGPIPADLALQPTV